MEMTAEAMLYLWNTLRDIESEVTRQGTDLMGMVQEEMYQTI